MVWFIIDKMCKRPSFAWSRAFFMISDETPAIFISIWKPVIPSAVPATLKSISPKWSSSPRMSERTAYLSPSVIKPIAIPATGFFIFTPAANIESVPPQTVAIEDEPFDSKISETTRTVYGKSFREGIIGWSERWARLPCPISRRPVASRPTSPTEYGGKL